jgi:hypothetical protein
MTGTTVAGMRLRVRPLARLSRWSVTARLSRDDRRQAEMAGNPDGPESRKVPNITPHDGDGSGAWKALRARDRSALRQGRLATAARSGGRAARDADPRAFQYWN